MSPCIRENRLLLIAIAILQLHTSSSERTSGLYVDNGMDQTVIHRVVSPEEKREVEHEILNLLGLPDRPPKHHSSAPQVKRSAPKFLLDIYKQALDDDAVHDKNSQNSVDFDLSGMERKAIDQSDIIMTFAARNHHVHGVRHERSKWLWFDVSEVPNNEHVINAELRLYRSLANVRNNKNRDSFTLTVYRVLRLEDGEKELQFVSSVNASAEHEGWITLNVSAAFQHWVHDPFSNRGLYLSVHPADRYVHEMKPEDIGIVGFRGDVETQPFMVAFLKSNGLRNRNNGKGSGTRSKRDTTTTQKRKKKPEVSLDYRINPYADPQIQYNTRTCKIQTLYVSFRDLQWQDWIIAPDGYDAYYCSGECNFPLNAHMNATNHAIVQTLVHLVNPGKVPKPCCAPTKLSPISVLYFLDESNVILKKYKNMVVKSCGCH